MRSTIHTPSDVQQETPTEHGCYKPGIDECLIPEVHGYNGREYKARQRHQYIVVFQLPHENTISVQIGQV